MVRKRYLLQTVRVLCELLQEKSLLVQISQQRFFFTSNIIPSDVPVENESGMLETGVPTMLISSPIKDRSNSVVGTVTLRIDVSEINTMMQNIHIGKTGETYQIG